MRSIFQQILLPKNCSVRKNQVISDNIRKFREYRNILSTCIEKAQIDYYNEIFSDRQTGIKNFWKTFGKTLNPKKKQKFMPSAEIVGR